jgi:hypothetical protein
MTDERREYDTGAVRSGDREKTRYDLVSPIGMKALARTYAEGAEKFGCCNWENGMPVTDLLNHALAHIYDFLSGDRSEDHLAHGAWNLLGAIHSMEMWPHLNADLLRGENCSPPPIAQASAVRPAAPTAGAGKCTAPQPIDSFEALRQSIFAKKDQ